MSLDRLRAAAKRADTAIHRPNKDDFQQFAAIRGYEHFTLELESADNETVTNLLVETPRYLRTFLYKTDIALLIITKCDADVLNRNIATITEERDDENNIHLYHPNRYLLLLLKNSRRVLQALIEKADIEILMQQQRKMPYSAFLLNTDSAYNEDHYQIYIALRNIYQENLNTNNNLAQKALYGMVSMILSLPNTLFSDRQESLNTLAYNNLKTHSHLTPLFKAYKASTLMAFANNANPKEITGASTIMMIAGHLLSHGKKANHKNLVKLLNKLNNNTVIDASGADQRAWYHLHMAELLGNFDTLALMDDATKEKMLDNALNHAELARNTLSNALLEDDREGWNRQEHIDLLNSAEKIIVTLRSNYQGKFQPEEKNAGEIILAIKNRIAATAWSVKTLFSTKPKHVQLMLNEIREAELGFKGYSTALRAIEKLANQAASEMSLFRDDGTQQFYVNMSNSVSRNNFLGLRPVQYLRYAAPVAAEEQPGSPRP